jgi:hypothetical protein
LGGKYGGGKGGQRSGGHGDDRGREWMKRSRKNSWGRTMDFSTQTGEIVKGVRKEM